MTPDRRFRAICSMSHLRELPRTDRPVLIIRSLTMAARAVPPAAPSTAARGSGCVGGPEGAWGGAGPGAEGAVEGVGVVVGEQVGDVCGGHGAVGEVVAGQVLAGAGEDGLEGGAFGL